VRLQGRVIHEQQADRMKKLCAFVISTHDVMVVCAENLVRLI
jgi:hypothetical protein